MAEKGDEISISDLVQQISSLSTTVSRLEATEGTRPKLYQDCEALNSAPTPPTDSGSQTVNVERSSNRTGRIDLQTFGQSLDPERSTHHSASPAETFSSAADILKDFERLRDSLVRIPVPNNFKVNDTTTGIKQDCRGTLSVLSKCARFAETGLKVLTTLPDERHSSSVSIQRDDLESIFVVFAAQINFLQSEYAGLVVKSTFNDETSRIFRSFENNASSFSRQSLQNVRIAAELASIHGRTNTASRSWRGRRRGVANQARGSYSSFPLNRSRDTIEYQKDWALQELAHLGWRVNWSKSNLEPSQKVCYIGYQVETYSDKKIVVLKIPKDRIKKVKRDISRTLEKKCISARALARIAGQCISMTKAVLPAKLLLRNLYRCLKTKSSWGDILELDSATLKDLEWWLEAFNYWNGRAYKSECSPVIQIATDASMEGWSCKGGPSGELTNIASKIWTLAIKNNVQITAHYLAGKLNIQADALSRLQSQHEWELNPNLYHYLDTVWGPHTIRSFRNDQHNQMQTLQQSVSRPRLLWGGRPSPVRLGSRNELCQRPAEASRQCVKYNIAPRGRSYDYCSSVESEKLVPKTKKVIHCQSNQTTTRSNVLYSKGPSTPGGAKKPQMGMVCLENLWAKALGTELWPPECIKKFPVSCPCHAGAV
ncbi:reverse transcriptase [Plakobranchus ocellatus]|uniref:Reverse transcriptase n=1 Tax=Plakobranchus ocellatus TaxID=259542 RepID=A0AAV4CDH1_9GAST|nr:reverse transcriptase [Plakobranchus ocellatus]